MKEFYTIGEVAKIYDVSTDTLRYYDRIGLVKPWIKGENGYRYYSKAQFEIISTIMLMRSMGTPVATLKRALEDESADSIRQELNRYCCSIDEEIARLEDLKAEAGRLDLRIEHACYGDDIRIAMRPRMWMFSKPFGSEDELDIEEILEVNRLARKKWTTRAGIVSTVTRENLIAEQFHIYDRYGYLSESPVDVKSPYLTELPEQLCAIGNARVRTVEHSEMDDAYRRIIAFAGSRGYAISGDAIERNVLDLYGGDPKNPVMFFDIYIPICRK